MAVDYSKLAFTSALRYEHIALKSHVAFSLPGAFAVTTVTIPHNLGYVPFFRLYYSFDAAGNVFPAFSGPGSFNINGNNVQVDDVHADSTNLYIQFENDNSSATPITGVAYYRIYAEAGA